MPELPEILGLSANLKTKLIDSKISKIEVGSLSVLKTFTPPYTELIGANLTDTSYKGKNLILEFKTKNETLYMCIHFALTGWVTWSDTKPSTQIKPFNKKSAALRIIFDDDQNLTFTERATDKRLGIWITADPESLNHINTLGLNADQISLSEFKQICEKSKAFIKNLLTDQQKLAGIGNTYSDEILFETKTSPITPSNKLSQQQIENIYESIQKMLSNVTNMAIDQEIDKLKTEKTLYAKIHGKQGKPCPVCQTNIAQVFFGENNERSYQYCPKCQNENKIIPDKRLSKLLK